MTNVRQIFQYVSYLQYPLMLAGAAYAFKPYVTGFDGLWGDLNNALVFFGLGVSLSTLQDTAKTQNKLSKRIWEDPKKGRNALIAMSVTAFVLVAMGLYGYFISSVNAFRELSFGIFVLGVGYIGLLKAAIEMYENHRKDKQPPEHNEHIIVNDEQQEFIN